MREAYKMTELGEIPEDWGILTIGEVAKLQGGYSFKSNDYIDDGVKLLKISNVYQKNVVWDEVNCLHPSYLSEYGDYALKKNDVVVAMTRPVISSGIKVAMIKEKDVPSLLNQRVGRFLVKDDLEKDYLYHYTFSDYFINKIRELSSATNQPNISAKQVESILIQLPPLPEQQKIASILSTVDENIEETDALIEKTKELKKGLMQKLLTKGIGHTEFKQTDLGEIPKEWEVQKLEEICDVKGGKRLPKGYKLQDENNGFPYIRVADMDMGGICLDDIKYVPEEAVETIKNYRISKDDIYISVAGTLGLVGEIPEELDNANLTENADKLCNIKCNNKYLVYFLQSKLIQNIIENERTLNAQPKLAINRIKSFNISLPSLPEQQKIASILSEVDNQIDQYEARKAKLQEFKKGLMQKLLTGKIRAKV